MEDGGNDYFLNEKNFPSYVKAISDRDIETLVKYYNDDFVFYLGGLQYDLPATLSFLTSSGKLTKSHFIIHSIAIEDDVLKSDTTENMTVLMDCDLLMIGTTKVGDVWEIKYTQYYTLRNGKISEIKADILSFSLVKSLAMTQS